MTCIKQGFPCSPLHSFLTRLLWSYQDTCLKFYGIDYKLAFSTQKFCLLLSTLHISFQYMQDFYNQTYINRHGVSMDASFQTLLWSLTVSMYPLGGFFGSLIVGPLVNNCGRYVTAVLPQIRLPSLVAPAHQALRHRTASILKQSAQCWTWECGVSHV